MRRAGFLGRHLWVTPYRPDEKYAAGDYPNQRAEGDGLPQWTEADRPIADTDLVVWYTFGHTHIPRPEDWPVMPVHRIGFMLKTGRLLPLKSSDGPAPLGLGRTVLRWKWRVLLLRDTPARPVQTSGAAAARCDSAGRRA